MITRIELENFKGIAERVGIDLRPITLLFGANSAGKSTVLHALQYGLEVLASGNANADRTRLGGAVIDLGGFASLIHGHNLQRRIGLRFEMDASEDSLADYVGLPIDAKKVGPDDLDRLDERLRTVWVGLEVGWSFTARAPQVFVYEVGWNGRQDPVVRIEAASTAQQAAMLTYDASDELQQDPGRGDGLPLGAALAGARSRPRHRRG